MKKLLSIAVLLWVGLVSVYAQNTPRREQVRNIDISNIGADGTKNGKEVVVLNSEGNGLILKSLPALELTQADIDQWIAISEKFKIQISNLSNGQLLRYNSTLEKWENWTPDFLKSTGTIDVAKKLETARTISLTGDITASGTFDGSANLPLNAQITSGAITNDEVSSSAAIEGTKISPNFGDQDIFTNKTVNAIGGLILGKDGGGQLGSIVFRDEGSPPNTLTLRPPKKINNPSYTLIFPEKAPNESELLQIHGIDTSDPRNTVGTLEWIPLPQYTAQTLTAATATPSGANLNLSQSGGTVRLYGGGATSVTYEADNTIKISSSDSYGPTYSSGTGISISGSNEISATTESFTDEAQTLSAAGDTSPTIKLSPVGSTGGGTITLAATSPIKLAQSDNIITISSDAPVASNLQQVTDAGNTTDKAMLVNEMVIHGDATVSGGSYPSGDNIRLGKSSTGVAPIGQRNIALGTESMKALMANGTPYDNIGIGYNTLMNMTSGDANIAIGSYALESNQTSNNIVAIGTGAFQHLAYEHSNDNVAIGHEAGNEKVNSLRATVVGTGAFMFGSTGNDDTAFGYNALRNTTGNNNTAVGSEAMKANTTGNNNVAIGVKSLYSNDEASDNIAIGSSALESNVKSNNIVAIGTGAFQSLKNDSSNDNIAIGYLAGNKTVSSMRTTVVGTGAFGLGDKGDDNTAMGYNALYSSKGSYNTAIGSEAMKSSSDVYWNTAVGYKSLTANTRGRENTAIGSQSMLANTTGEGNTAVGATALSDNTIGGANAALGDWSLGQNTTGGGNTAIGSRSLAWNTAGSGNVAVGVRAGRPDIIALPDLVTITKDAENSIYIGSDTRIGADDGVGSGVVTNEIVIGSEAFGHGSNTINLNKTKDVKLYIGNNNSEDADRVYFEPLRKEILDVVTSGWVLTAKGYDKLPVWEPAGTGCCSLQDVTTIGNTTNKAILINSMTVHGSLANDNIRLGINNDAASTSKDLAPIGERNIAIGKEVMKMNQATALDNTGVGYQSLNLLTEGDQNVAVGNYALSKITTSTKNTAVGYSALANSTGGYNTAIGANTLLMNDAGIFNTAVGADALYANTTGKHNTALGNGSLTLNDTGDNNTAVGHLSLPSNKAGKENSSLGSMSLFWNSTGSNNTAIGSEALRDNTTGNFNTALGHQALASNTVLEGITAVGYQALYNLKDGMGGNVAIGYRSLYMSDDGEDNTAIGYQTLYSNEGGSYNIAIGGSALYSNTGGENNVAIGNAALFKNTGGEQNIAIGNNALRENTYGFGSTAVGIHALDDNLSGGNNSAFGRFAMSANITGSYNVAVGDNSGNGFSPSNSVYVGANTFSSDKANNEIVIGADSKGYGSHSINLNSTYGPKLYVGNEGTTSRVYYEPLYYNKVGALGTVLAGQGTGVMPIWKDISITGEGIVTVSPNGKSEDLTWVIKAECCPIKIEVDKDGNLIFYQDGKLIEIESADNGKTSMPIGLGLVYDSNTKQYNLPATGTKIKEYSTEFTVLDPKIVEYTLEATPSVNCSPKVFLNGVRLRSTAYSINGDKITYIKEGNIDIETGNPVALDINYFFHVDYFTDL